MNRRGFTLVELLVVIGIIALLISILLPSLARARQSAVSIDCQSRMRQMGQAVQFYVNEYRGMLPASDFNYPDTPGNSEDWIPSTLTRMLGKECYDRKQWHPIFRDLDFPDIPAPIPSWADAYNHYNWNLRLFHPLNNAGVGDTDRPGRPPFTTTRRMTSVTNASEVVAAWDGQIFKTGVVYPWGANAYFLGDGLSNDTGGWIYFPTGLVLNRTGVNYDQKIGSSAAFDGRQGHVDFRHNKRTSANLLFLDGHVESRRKGELYVKDFCTVSKH